MERDCESELSKLNIEQNACIYHFGASVIHGQRSNILRLPSYCLYYIYISYLKQIGLQKMTLALCMEKSGRNPFVFGNLPDFSKTECSPTDRACPSQAAGSATAPPLPCSLSAQDCAVPRESDTPLISLRKGIRHYLGVCPLVSNSCREIFE